MPNFAVPNKKMRHERVLTIFTNNSKNQKTMAILISGRVIKLCPTVEVSYLGEAFRHADVLIEQAPETGSDWRPSKIVVRLKGAKIDEFKARGLDADGTYHDYTLHIEAMQNRDDANRIYNKVPTVIDFK